MKIFVLALFLSLVCQPEDYPNPKGYQFKEKWFDYNIPVWKSYLGEYKGKKELVYVEVGAYEGRSFFWILDHVLTHPTSKAYAIDLFEKNGQYQDSFTERFFYNLNRSGSKDRVVVLKGSSHEKLSYIKPESVDILYVDGSHLSYDVYTDIADGWRILKKGGLLILDDYLYTFDKKIPIGASPKLAIDSFLTAFGGELQLLYKDSQVFIKKLERPCHGGTIFFIGENHYCFYHEGLSLLDKTNEKFISLTRYEQNKLLDISCQRSFGQEKGDADLLKKELPDLFKKLSGNWFARFLKVH